MQISMTKKCEKKEKGTIEQTGEWPFSIPLDNKSLSSRISYIYLLFCTVAEKILIGNLLY